MTDKTSIKKQDLPNIEMFNTSNNMFYVRTKPLNKHSACTAESILRNFREKNVFILMFDEFHLDYENVLKAEYANLLTTKVDGKKYLRGTPFKWDRQNYNKSMIVAGLLTLWQFGGTILSDNLVSCKKPENNPKMTEGSCIVDYELLSCAEQCSAYVYDFMKTIMLQNIQDGAAPIVDK
uniref:Uncharacterized protein n=1 Tax=Rhodnius prolixus TaxID=13249 RepID=T1I2A0_RHOPR